MWSVEAGGSLFGTNGRGDADGLGLLLVGAGGTRVRRISVSRLEALARDPNAVSSVCAVIDDFVAGISTANEEIQRPQIHTSATHSRQYKLDKCERLGPDHVVWVRHIAGSTLFAGKEDLVIDTADGPVPVGKGLWLTAAEDGTELTTTDTISCIQEGHAVNGLLLLRALFMAWTERETAAVEAAEEQRLRRKSAAEELMRERGLAKLAAVIGGGGAEPRLMEAEDRLLSACMTVGKPAGIDFKEPPQWEADTRSRDPLAAICRASRVRLRRVALRGKWWRTDSGPLLAYLEDGQKPVALIAPKPGKYVLVDPESERSMPVNEEVASRLEAFAFSFYRPFPDEPIGGIGLARAALRDVGTDFGIVVFLALCAGLLGLAVPVTIGKMFSDVIPSAQPGVLPPCSPHSSGFTSVSPCSIWRARSSSSGSRENRTERSRRPSSTACWLFPCPSFATIRWVICRPVPRGSTPFATCSAAPPARRFCRACSRC